MKPGGFLFQHLSCEWVARHGFYQFSPEFCYRTLVFHGFEVERLYLAAIQFPEQWYRVDDPRKIKERITFLSSEPINALVVARRGRRAFKRRCADAERLCGGKLADRKGSFDSGRFYQRALSVAPALGLQAPMGPIVDHAPAMRCRRSRVVHVFAEQGPDGLVHPNHRDRQGNGEDWTGEPSSIISNA